MEQAAFVTMPAPNTGISLKKDAAAFREEKFHPDPEQYAELLDTRIQIRPDFRDKLIEQLKGTFGKYYDYHRRDIATNEVDYLNVEYYGAAEPPVRCGESHLSGLTEPPHFIY